MLQWVTTSFKASIVLGSKLQDLLTIKRCLFEILPTCHRRSLEINLLQHMLFQKKKLKKKKKIVINLCLCYWDACWSSLRGPVFHFVRLYVCTFVRCLYVFHFRFHFVRVKLFCKQHMQDYSLRFFLLISLWHGQYNKV